MKVNEINNQSNFGRIVLGKSAKAALNDAIYLKEISCLKNELVAFRDKFKRCNLDSKVHDIYLSKTKGDPAAVYARVRNNKTKERTVFSKGNILEVLEKAMDYVIAKEKI